MGEIEEAHGRCNPRRYLTQIHSILLEVLVKSKRILLVSVLVAIVTGGGTLLAGPAQAAPSSIWQVQTTANPQATALTNSSFQGVSASGPDEAWAVGTHSDTQAADHPLVEHWNGTTWTAVTVPQPAGQQATLSGVDDLGPADAWAVGTTFNGSDQDALTLIEHWNGTSWSIVPSPNPAAGIAGDSDELSAVAGTGPNDLWAVGSDNDEASQTIFLLFEHWNGTTWTAVPSPTPFRSAQFGTSVAAVSPNDVWAVGIDQTGQRKTLSAHWNGQAWSIVPTRDITGTGSIQNELTGVSAEDGTVWTSGFAFNVHHRNFRVPFVQQWNGTKWIMTKLPNMGSEGTALNGIHIVSPTDVWAVGQAQESNGSILTLTEQFDGSVWSIIPSPSPGSVENLTDSSLDAVTAAGGANVFAVGAQETPGQEGLRTLAIATAQG